MTSGQALLGCYAAMPMAVHSQLQVGRHALSVQVFRQRNPEFVRMLNDIRTGNGTAAIQQLLKQCTRPLPEQHGVKPPQLFSRNADVDTVNAAELNALEGQEVGPAALPRCRWR